MIQSTQEHNLPECITVTFDQTVPLTLVKPGGPTLVTLLIYVLDCCVTSTKILNSVDLTLIIFCLLTRVSNLFTLWPNFVIWLGHTLKLKCASVRFSGGCLRDAVKNERRSAESDEAPAWSEDIGRAPWRALNHVLSTRASPRGHLRSTFFHHGPVCLHSLVHPSQRYPIRQYACKFHQRVSRGSTTHFEIVWKCHILRQQLEFIHFCYPSLPPLSSVT